MSGWLTPDAADRPPCPTVERPWRSCEPRPAAPVQVKRPEVETACRRVGLISAGSNAFMVTRQRQCPESNRQLNAAASRAAVGRNWYLQHGRSVSSDAQTQ